MTGNRQRAGTPHFGRRVFLAAAAFSVMGAGVATTRAGSSIGKATDVRGRVDRHQSGQPETLTAGADLLDQDHVVTGVDSFADLLLGRDTRILLGSETDLMIDTYLADTGGVLELGTGVMVFDRPEGLPKIDLAIRTTFGMIGVRGTKFFAGPNRGVFAIFVEHGLVELEAGGVTQAVAPGEGIEVAVPGGRPTVPVRWGQARIDEAYRSVGL